MALATISFPVPLSPCSRMVALVSAARRTMFSTARIRSLFLKSRSRSGQWCSGSDEGLPTASPACAISVRVRAEAMACWISAGAAGLTMKSDAPVLMARTTKLVSRTVDSARTTVSVDSSRICWISSKGSVPGASRSTSTTWGRSVETSASPSVALAAVSTEWPPSLTSRASVSRLSGSESMMSVLG